MYLIYATRATFLAHLPLLEPIIVTILGEAKLTDCHLTITVFFSLLYFSNPVLYELQFTIDWYSVVTSA